MEIISDLKKFLIEKKFLTKDETLDKSDSLLEKGIIDSISILEINRFIEKEYRIKVDEDDMMPENFDSLNAIENYVNEQLA